MEPRQLRPRVAGKVASTARATGDCGLTNEQESASNSDEEEPLKAPAAATAARKQPRHLSDIDRRVLIQRLERGEKQADLAREFGVTRAAVSHINKNKDHVLTRFDAFARSPHGRMLIGNYSRPSTDFKNVVEVSTAAARVLTTRLKSRLTAPLLFRASADRLIKLLLEEALVSFGTASMSSDSMCKEGEGCLKLESLPQVVPLSVEGELMLKIFDEMEPEATAPGAITSSPHTGPVDTSASSVLVLIPVLASAAAALKAIQELGSRGVDVSWICIVCVFSSIDAVKSLVAEQPDVNLITASIDTPPSESSVDLLSSFVGRYRSGASASALGTS